MNQRRLRQRKRTVRYGDTVGFFNARVPAVAAVLLLFAFASARPGLAETVVLAFGDSLTAGYGVSAQDSFPVQLEAALKSTETPARVINGSVSGDTSAGGLARIDWLLGEKPDLVIVELGANDGLRGLDPKMTRENMDRIIQRFRDAGVSVLVAGMKAPPNLGSEYGASFEALYSDLARAHGTAFYPFFLDGVAGNPSLNQPDGIHPTAEGVAVIVEKMLPVVVAALKEAVR